MCIRDSIPHRLPADINRKRVIFADRINKKKKHEDSLDRPEPVSYTHLIYGGDDPWTASGVTWLKNKKNIKVYVLPGGSHTTRIGSFDTDTQEEIKTQINAWLNKE